MTKQEIFHRQLINSFVKHVATTPTEEFLVRSELIRRTREFLTGMMAWDLLYNVLGGAGGGVIQVVRNLQNPRKYSNRIAVELGLSMFVSAFAGLLTYLLVASSDAVSVNGLFMLFLSCCAGVLGYEAIKLYTDDFKKTVKGKTDA